MEQKRDYRAEIQQIKREYMAAALTYDGAKEKCQPILDAMNARMKAVCKENGMPFKKLTFSYVFR